MATEQEQAAVIRALHETDRPIVVVDLGSHHADEHYWLSGLFELARYIAVEADPRNAAVIRNRFRPVMGKEQVTLIEGAIAAHNGTIKLHLCDNKADQAKGSSSTHQPTGHLEHFKWCTFDESVEVPAITLDKLAVDIPVIDLLWADLQGAERDMIAGGTEALKRVRFLMIEAESVELYEGQALKPELLALLPDFEVVEDLGYNVFLRRRGM